MFLLKSVDYKDIAFEDASGTVQAHINIGSGREISIRHLAEIVQEVVGFKNKLVFDVSKSDGISIKLMNSSLLMELGWEKRLS